MTDDEIQRGRFLTNDQREYLLGNHKPNSANAESQVRSKIRRRTKGAIHDLAIIAQNLERKDRSLLLKMETPESTEPNEMTTLPNGKMIPLPHDNDGMIGLWDWVGFNAEMIPIIEFYYKALREKDLEDSAFSKNNITKSIEAALEMGERDFQGIGQSDRYNVEAKVEVETTKEIDIEKAKRRYQEGKDIRPIELKALVESGHANIQLSDE